MRTKTPLVLMEQLVMVLVFALAAVICLRMFVLSNNLSEHYAAADRAALEAQAAAEHMKHGMLEQYAKERNAVVDDGVWTVAFDDDWNVVQPDEKADYTLSITEENSGHELLWCARIQVCTDDGKELFAIPVSGQIDEGVTAHA